MLRHFQSLVLAALILVAAGCGSSSQDFVLTPTNNNNNPPVADSGILAFRFQQPAAQTTLDSDVETLRFDLYTSNPPSNSTLVFSESRLPNPVVYLNNVPLDVVYVRVTSFNRFGLPIARYEAEFQVVAGEELEVTLGPGTPVAFQDFSVDPDPVVLIFTDYVGTASTVLTFTGLFDGEEVNAPAARAEVTFDNPALLNFLSSTGEVTTTVGQLSASLTQTGGLNSSATATYTVGNTTLEDDFQVNVFIFLDQSGTGTPREVTRGSSLTYNSSLFFYPPTGQLIPLNPTDNDISFALEAPVQGVTVNPTTGEVTTSAGTPLGEFTVLATWTDDERPGASGLTFTTGILYEVVAP